MKNPAQAAAIKYNDEIFSMRHFRVFYRAPSPNLAWIPA